MTAAGRRVCRVTRRVTRRVCRVTRRVTPWVGGYVLVNWWAAQQLRQGRQNQSPRLQRK